jgi:cytochrome c oxidase subunit 3
VFWCRNLHQRPELGEPGEASPSILYTGLFFFAATLFVWFRTTVRENLAGMNSGQLKKSYVLGMYWFIFSEVMFLPRSSAHCSTCVTSPALAGREGEGGRMNYLLWEGFQFSWPMMQTPQEAVGGAGSQLIANNGSFTSPGQSMAFSRGPRLVRLAAAVEHDHPAVIFRDGAHRAHGIAGW